MKQLLKTISILIFVLVTIFSTWAQQKSDLYTFKVKKVKEGIFLAYRAEPLRQFVEGNVTIIVNDNDVVLVDGGGSTTSAKNIIAEVKKITSNPIRYVINTHPHVDHTLGNEEYVRSCPGVEIISHPLTKQELMGAVSYGEGIGKNFDKQRASAQETIKNIKTRPNQDTKK